MPKSQIVEPAEERKAGTLPIAEIPLNQYQQDLAKEKEAYGADALVGMYEDMLLIREFESMLQNIKTQGSYEGIEYDHKGPAHLSIGQEASAVGQAFLLGVDDHIFGSHRSHGEILAKGMSAIRKLDDDSLLEIMESFLGGDCYRVVEKEESSSVKDLARNFLLYGALAEIFGRANGFNRGMGGSMHAFFPRFSGYCNGCVPVQKSEPQKRNSHFQYRGCVHGMRSHLGSDEFCFDAPVQGVMGFLHERGLADHLQLHE
jgi:2-oxoisovalerate dehydrogenase E1 component